MLVVEISFITENVYIHLTYVFSIDPNSQEDDGLTAADVCLFSLVLKSCFPSNILNLITYFFLN
jgi:hypothetical protein